MLASSLAACMGHHGPSADQVRDSMQDYHAQNDAGYRALHQYEPLPEQRENWREGSGTVDVSLLMPDSAAQDSHPLILYLPGLGEEVDAGSQWREAWVRAGYAVLGLQSPHDSSALRSLSGHEEHDPRWIGHRHFSETSLEKRLATVQAVLDGLSQRAGVPGSVYSKIDFNRVAVAGYDLGAQTTAALSGEKTRTVLSPLRGVTICAALLFSPHVNLASGNLTGRFKSVDVPFMAVTGTEDSDPFGMSSPSLRREIWKQAPAPNQYLLVMEGASHALMSGNSLDAMLRESDSDMEGQGRGLFGFRTTRLPLIDAQGSMEGGAGKAFRKPTPESMARQLIAIQEITTAFLDEQIYQSEKARGWLKQSVNGYLGSLGSLRGR